MTYSEDEYLMLSGIQHFLFCRRQWALIHVEQQWKENELTSSGELFHKKAHDPTGIEKRGDTVIVRGLRIHSASMGISGNCDVVEFHRAADGISVNGLEGRWSVLPIEYKSGKYDFDETLRKKVTDSFQEMHEYFNRGYTPKCKPRKGCARCSLRDLCLPEMTKIRSVKTYISERVEDH